MDPVISDLSITTSTTNVKLQWKPLTWSNVRFEYEVAYAAIPGNKDECQYNDLPDEYIMHLHPQRSSIGPFHVLGLMPGICYVFGVRVYASLSEYPGVFNVISAVTVSDCK